MKIYLNHELSWHFGVSYNNDKEQTIIHSSALLSQNNNWDVAHKEILSVSRDLQLLGVGFGWWEIMENGFVVKPVSQTDYDITKEE